MKTSLLIIDMQNCFTNPNGELYVNGADKDVLIVSEYIKSNYQQLDSIAITGDFHPTSMISFPNWWVDNEGNNPKPFEVISLEDVENGRWKAFDKSNQEWALHYVRTLEEQNKSKLNNFFDCRIWPYHGITGTPGANFDPELMEALSPVFNEKVLVVAKGQNPLTEQHGALKGDVIVPGDARTDYHSELLTWITNALKDGGRILACGEALDICFAYTIYSILEIISVEQRSQITILQNASSAIYPDKAVKFLKDMEELGVSVGNL